MFSGCEEKMKRKKIKNQKNEKENRYNVMWMRKGVAGKRNKKIRKMKKNINTM